MGPFYVTQSNPAHRLTDPTQPNGTMEQCCSQGQNPKAKDEAEAMAWTLEVKAKTKDTNVCPRGSLRPSPVLEDYITAMES